MVVESAQMLSTVSGGPYKPTHANHPSTIWTRTHAFWVYDHFAALLDEYRFRYGRIHKCDELLDPLAEQIRHLPRDPWTDPPQCMPDQYRDPLDTVKAYRDYYVHEKAYFARWNNGRGAPDWFMAHPSLNFPQPPITTTHE